MEGCKKLGNRLPGKQQKAQHDSPRDEGDVTCGLGGTKCLGTTNADLKPESAPRYR
jgi:hypothetical protein